MPGLNLARADPANRPAVSTGWLVAGTAALLAGVATVAFYAWQASAGGTVLASGLMFGGAALLAGGLLGFLFGIPRTLTGEARQPDATIVTAAERLAVPAYGANTNLEQISDWLTKILVGIGLVQFGAIRSGFTRLLGALAPSLGDRSDSAAFAGAILLYFSVLGFLGGWLLTRLLLAPALSAADRRVLAVLAAADLAEAEGDTERANHYRQEALALFQRTAPSARLYESLRATAPPGRARTQQMEDLIERARQEVQADPSITAVQARELFEQGEDGQRVYALGLMQSREELADLETALEAIEHSRSAFEQYHGIELARRMLPTLSDTEQQQLVDALQRQRRQGGWIRRGTDRWDLSQEILDAVERRP